MSPLRGSVSLWESFTHSLRCGLLRLPPATQAAVMISRRTYTLSTRRTPLTISAIRSAPARIRKLAADTTAHLIAAEYCAVENQRGNLVSTRDQWRNDDHPRRLYDICKCM